MKKRLAKLLAVCLLGTLLTAIPVYAASSATITVTETSGNSYSMIGASASIDNDYLASHDFISSSGLDVDLNGLPFMLADDRTVVAMPLGANETALLSYTTGNTPASAFQVLLGYNGYITVPNAAAIELGNNFEVEQQGYIDTTEVGDDLAMKADAFRTYISAPGAITSTISGGILDSQVGANTDDCWAYWDGGGWKFDVDPYNYIYTGFISVANQKCGGGMRFTNVNILQGAVINTANLTLKSMADYYMDNVNTVISGEDEDTTVAFSDYANYSGRSHTAATVNWNAIAHWTPYTDYDSPEIKTIIQEIVDRPGWVAGNDIVIFWDDHADNSTHVNGTFRGVATHDISPAGAAKLHIDWEAGAAETTVTAAGISSDEHTVTTSANVTHLAISIDGVQKDIAVLASAVPNSGSNWTIMNDNCIPYLEYMTIDVAGVEKLRYQPVTIVTNTGAEGTVDNGTTTTLVDADALTQIDDYWNHARLIITDTTDDLAPKGEDAVITDFTAADDTLHFAALTAAPEAGDTYTVDFGTLTDETGSNDGTITWGVNPTGVTVSVGALLPEVVVVPATTGTDVPDLAPEYSPDVSPGVEGENFPFYGLFKGLIDDFHNVGGPEITMPFFWKVAAAITALISGTLVLIATRNIPIGIIAYALFIAIPTAMGILDWYYIVWYVVGAVAIALLVSKWTSSSI